MSKRDSFNIRKKILQILKNNPLTFAQLERKINTNSETIKNDCHELQFYKLINIKEKIHPSNGRKSYEVSLTESGKEVSD
jgi:predicted transcriptional regulator